MENEAIDLDDFLIKEIEQKYAYGLQERLLKFAIDTIRFLFLLPYTKEMALCNKKT